MASPASVFDASEFLAHKPDSCTSGYVMQQTNFRIKDPKRSLKFYVEVLGMHLLCSNDFPDWGFSIYFLGYLPSGAQVPQDQAERANFAMTTPGCVELTWNHGSETSAEDRIYNTGNADATGTADGKPVKGGFGHIGITVPDVYAACQRFRDLGAEIKKSPNAGGMAGIAFLYDPDGYLVEVLPPCSFPFPTQPEDCCGVKLGGGVYTDNSKT